jgi:predicted lipid-binding transport protein (Tim44 family)
VRGIQNLQGHEARADHRPLAILAASVLIALLLLAYVTARLHQRQVEAINALRTSVAALQAPAPVAVPAVPAPAPEADRPAMRQATPRRSTRPAPAAGAAPNAPGPAYAPAAPPVRWGTTDLDRAIAAHPPVRVP